MTVADHHLRDEAEPWALNLVVRAEKDAPPQHTDLLEAAATATVLLLNDERAFGAWEPAIARWHDGRIRKLCRRARAGKWDATAALDHVEVSIGSATVRAFVPCAVDDQPPVLFRLQLAGTDFEDETVPASSTAVDGPAVWLNPAIAMSSAKAAVQASHAAQLVLERWRAARPLDVAAWLARGAPLRVRTADPQHWASLVESSTRPERFAVQVHDAGFTEIPAGSLTAIGQLG